MRIETERLILREINPERDFEGWAETQGDEETVRYTIGKVMDRAGAWQSMAASIGHWCIRGYGLFSVESKETGEWVGRVGPWYPLGWPAPEIGWTILRRHWGKGYATEAAMASLDHVYNTLGWESVIHAIVKGNDASVAVARKLGSRLLRTQQGLEGVTDKEVLLYGQERPS